MDMTTTTTTTTSAPRANAVRPDAKGYSLTDLIRLIDPNDTRDEAVLRNNLSFYKRKYARDPEYASFFEHVHQTFVRHGLLGRAASSAASASSASSAAEGNAEALAEDEAPSEAKDPFDLSRYTIGELASALDYDINRGDGGSGDVPDIQTLRRDRRAYQRRLAPVDGDEEEETRHKDKARAFFDGAYDMLTAYLYPNYGGLRSATERVRRMRRDAPDGGEDEATAVDSMAPPGMGMLDERKDHGLVERPRAVSSQMASRPVADGAADTGAAAPNEKRTRTTIVNVDTRFRKNYFDKSRGEVSTSSDIYFSLDERVKNVRQMSIASLEYPNSAYAISSALKSNVFYIQVCENGYQTRENAGTLKMPGTTTDISGHLPPVGTQHYIDHDGTHHAVANTGALGTYRISMMSGNYNKDTLVASINYALRTTDVSSGLAAVMVEFNTAFNKMVMRTVDASSSDMTEAASIYYPGVNVIYEGRTYRGTNSTGGLVTGVAKPFKYNLYFDMFEELDASGNYNLTKPLVNRPLFFNAGWVMGFRKERYIYADDYVLRLEKQTATDEVGGATTEASYFLGYNAESPYDVNAMRYFYVCISDYVTSGNSNYIQGVRNETNYVQTMYGMPSDVIARIVNNGPKLHYTFFDRADFINKTRIYDVPVTLQNFKIRMTDEYGRELDLNKMDWSMALELTSEVD